MFNHLTYYIIIIIYYINIKIIIKFKNENDAKIGIHNFGRIYFVYIIVP